MPDAVVALLWLLNSGANMAVSESAPAVNPATAEGEEETILYDLLVNTEWPSETEVQVTRPLQSCGQLGAGAVRAEPRS